jgi:hypothetical protein
VSVADVREALAEAVRSTGLKCVAYPHGNVNPPEAWIIAGEFDPRLVYGSPKASQQFIIRLHAGLVADTAGHKLLDVYRETSGVQSVVAAINESVELNDGEAADYAQVINVSPVSVAPMGALEYLVTDYTVEVVF